MSTQTQDASLLLSCQDFYKAASLSVGLTRAVYMLYQADSFTTDDPSTIPWGEVENGAMRMLRAVRVAEMASLEVRTEFLKAGDGSQEVLGIYGESANQAAVELGICLTRGIRYGMAPLDCLCKMATEAVRLFRCQTDCGPRLRKAEAAANAECLLVTDGLKSVADGTGGNRKSASTGERKRGCKPKTDPKADRKVAEAWKSGQHKSYADVAQSLDMTRKEVEKAIDRDRKRRGKRRNNSATQ